jgi:hypothetical protein
MSPTQLHDYNTHIIHTLCTMKVPYTRHTNNIICSSFIHPFTFFGEMKEVYVLLIRFQMLNKMQIVKRKKSSLLLNQLLISRKIQPH